MIGLLVVTHDTLGASYTKLAEHIFGSLPVNMRVLDVEISDLPETVYRRVEAAAAETNAGYGVLVLGDIFGATPCNIARQLVGHSDIILLTGLNAPMMVKAVQYAQSSTDLRELAERVRQAAIDGILLISSTDDKND